MEAKDEHELAGLLRKEGYLLVSVQPAGGEKLGKKANWNVFSSFFPVSLAEKMMFTRNLQVMISAGISLPRVLNILSSQAKSGKLRRALKNTEEKITKGQNFSGALAQYPDIFPEFFVRMIGVGEESGTLEEVLKNITLQMEREYELTSKIKGAMMYPAVVVAAMVLIGILMLIVVVPQLAATFAEMQMALPFTTRIVIGLGSFLAAKWYLLPFFLLIFVVVIRTLLKTKHGKMVKDFLFLQAPAISAIVKQSNTAYIIRTLSSLIASGVPLLQALEIISRSVGNTFFQKAVADGCEKVKKGGKLSDALSRYPRLFPITVVQMMQVGEETGQTADILRKLSDFYEEEVTNAAKNLSTIIEPILMLMIGSIVGFFAVAMIQPLYSMMQTL
ncbi:MAG: Type IV pilin [Parcubacteria group bacterium GW2011_GWA2_47_9]|nr:MAG: Type IV pilin [Parcubacteria group bacterium GW2011_GWA2_47_9]